MEYFEAVKKNNMVLCVDVEGSPRYTLMETVTIKHLAGQHHSSSVCGYIHTFSEKAHRNRKTGVSSFQQADLLDIGLTFYYIYPFVIKKSFKPCANITNLKKMNKNFKTVESLMQYMT